MDPADVCVWVEGWEVSAYAVHRVPLRVSRGGGVRIILARRECAVCGLAMLKFDGGNVHAPRYEPHVPYWNPHADQLLCREDHWRSMHARKLPKAWRF